MSETTVVQRLRIHYAVGGPMRYVSVLDQGRIWERLLRRADIPLAYTQGYNPRPRLQLGTALPVGYGSDCEFIDLFLSATMAPETLAQAIAPQLPLGLNVHAVQEVPLKAAAVQSRVREARYEVRVWTDEVSASDSGARIKQAIDTLLARVEIPRQRHKKGRLVDYDLRPLILDIRYHLQHDSCHLLIMRLRAGPQGSGRPEEVLAELGLADGCYRIQRRELVLAEE
jgi:radical SAM-linked protein